MHQKSRVRKLFFVRNSQQGPDALPFWLMSVSCQCCECVPTSTGLVDVAHGVKWIFVVDLRLFLSSRKSNRVCVWLSCIKCAHPVGRRGHRVICSRGRAVTVYVAFARILGAGILYQGGEIGRWALGVDAHR